MKQKLFNIFATILSVLLAISITLFFYAGITLAVAEGRHNIQVKPYSCVKPINFDLKTAYTYENNFEIRKDLEKIYKPVVYFYAEGELNSSIGAQTILPLRHITMNSKYVNIPYAYTFFLAHEFVHITYCVTNECFTEFTAFKTLYESGNEWFRNVALWRANDIVTHNLQDTYDCGYYILEYLEG